MSHLTSLGLLLLALVAPTAAAPPSPATARELLGRPLPEAVAAYQQWDISFRGGRGSSDRETSGDLAWGEATFLRNYLSCWTATRDTYWLDKFVDHFDRMLTTQHDRHQTGFLAWDSLRYSVGLVQVKEKEQAGGMTLTPETQSEPVTRRGANVTGHRYAILLRAADAIRIVDLDRKQVVLGDTPYLSGMALDLFAGKAYASARHAADAQATTPLVLTGTGRAGAQFIVQTTAPEWIQFVVHDGMVTYPLAQFIEVARTTPDLDARYRAAADRYLAWFDRHIYQKWEPRWRALDAETGAYTFTLSPTERYPGYLLPHNQYLALARAYLVLQALDGVPRREAYRGKALAMLRYFRRALRPALDGRAYVWNYWDPAPGEDVRRHIEDDSHGAIDVGALVEAVRRELVFGPDDAVKLARTYVDVMGNGDAARPRVAGQVDGTGAKTDNLSFDWALLGEWDEAVYRQVSAMTASDPAAQPQRVEVVARLGGVTAADRAACRAASVTLKSVVAAAAGGNGGFEAGLPGVGPLGWTFALWSESSVGHLEWSTDAAEGQRSVALVGVSGHPNPNVVLERSSLELTGPTRFTVHVRYKTAGHGQPSLSFLCPLPGGQRQYDTSPTFAASETWQTATWTVTSAKGATLARFALRNGGVGTVWYDDFRLESSPAK